MKLILTTVFALIATFTILAQEKLKYNKDVYPLIKAEQYEEALPVLQNFLCQKPEHANANYWAAKIYEMKALNEINIGYAQQAKSYYITCRNNVQLLDMSIVNSSRFPDANGLEAEERLSNFQNFLSQKMEEMSTFKNKIKKTSQDKFFKTYEEFVSTTQFNLPDEISTLQLIDLDCRYETAELNGKKKLDGYLGFQAVSLSKNMRINFQGLVENNQLKPTYTLKEYEFKPELQSVNGITLTDLNNLLKFDISKYLGYSVNNEVTLSGQYESISIGGNISVGGKINLKGDNVAVFGEMKNQTGFIVASWMNYDTYAQEAIKIEIQNDSLTRFRYEINYANGTPRFYEIMSNISAISSNSYFDFELQDSKLIDKGEVTEILNFDGYENNEDSGVDIIFIGYRFHSKNNKELFFEEDEIDEKFAATLKDERNNGGWFSVTYTLLEPETKLFKDVEASKKMIALKKVELFDVNDYASKYNESLSQSDLTTLNSLGKKWLQSLQEGNYELYKSVVAKPFQISLAEFTKMTNEVKSISFKSSNTYVIGRLDNSCDLYRPQMYRTLVDVGADKSISVIMKDNLQRGDNSFGAFYFVKINGTWKIAFWDKHGPSDYSIESIKAFKVISKNPPKICDCVAETAAGNSAMSEKCHFYYSYIKERKKVISDFVACLNESNYCNYTQVTSQIYQSERKTVSLVDLMNEMYQPNTEELEKLNSLKLECK